MADFVFPFRATTFFTPLYENDNLELVPGYFYVNRKQKFEHWAFLIGHNKLEYVLFNCKFNFKLKTEFVNFN